MKNLIVIALLSLFATSSFAAKPNCLVLVDWDGDGMMNESFGALGGDTVKSCKKSIKALIKENLRYESFKKVCARVETKNRKGKKVTKYITARKFPIFRYRVSKKNCMKVIESGI